MPSPAKTAFLRQIVCLICLLATVLAVAGPAMALGGPEKIAQRVIRLLKQGRELAACREAVKLAPYAKTPAYRKAAQALLAHGISIEDPMASYTAKVLIKLENQLEAQRAATGRLPATGIRKKVRDAWGRPVRVELVTRKGFIYAIRSAGRDGQWLTSDDLTVGVREDDPRWWGGGPSKDPLRDKGRANLYRRQEAAPPPPKEPELVPGVPAGGKGGPKEVEVNLEDLLKR